MYPRPIRLLAIALVLSSFLPEAVNAGECVAAHRPGATLLFPYFEVDLDDSEARKTLISIQNMSDRPVLTNVVVWTNCGLPVFSFNLALEANGSRPLDVRDLLTNGRIPTSGEDVSFPDCASPVDASNIEESELLALQAHLTGQPDPVDGMCYAETKEPSTLAVGHITVDVVWRCSETIRTPWDTDYFSSDVEVGIAADQNVLSGDFFLIDDAGDLAQGSSAVAVVADPAIRDVRLGGFYRQEGDNRRPLGSHYRTRFFEGGAFDGGTEILLWTAPTGYGSAYCGSGCDFGPFGSIYADVVAHREKGPVGVLGVFEPLFLTSNTSRLRVGSEDIPVDSRSGTLDFSLFFTFCGGSGDKCTPPSKRPNQAWLMPIFTAEGRFSVGLEATALDDPCAGF